MHKYRIIILFNLIIFQLFVGLNVFAQKLINESFFNESMPLVLKEVSEKYKFKFSYDYSLLEKVIVTDDYINLTKKKFMRQLTSKYNFDFEEIDGVYIISPRKKTAQKFIVKGLVVDSESKERLPYANIYDKKTSYNTASNQEGYFTIFMNNADTAKFMISYMGYKTREFVVCSNDSVDVLQIKLESEDKLISKVDVQSNNIKSVDLGQMAGHFTVNPAKMADLPVLGELDIFRNLQLFPGIGGTDNSSSGLIIRNSPSDQTLVTFDGFSILDLNHFFGMFSAINSKVVKDIQIYKGGFEAKYGNRVSGMVEITGKSGNLSKPTVHFNLNMLSANLVIQVPLFKKASLLIAARRSYNEIVKTSLYDQIFDKVKSPIDNSYWLVNGTVRYLPNQLEPVFRFYDLNFKLNLPLSKKDILGISFYLGKDNLDFLDSTAVEYDYQMLENMNWGNRGLGLKWTRNWSKKVFSNFSLNYSNYFNYYLSDYSYSQSTYSDTSLIYESNNIDNINLKINTTWYINKKHTFEIGLDNNTINVDFLSFWNDNILQDIRQFAKQLSVFAQDKYSVSSKLYLIAGLRTNFISSSEVTNIEPRLSLQYKVSPLLNLKVSAGNYHQYLNKIPVKNLAGINRDYWMISDNILAPAVASSHYTIGFNLKKRFFTIDFEAYYKNTLNLIEYESAILNEISSQTNDLEGVYHKGEGKIAGIDVLLLKEYGKYSGWIAYSLGKSLRKFPDINNGQAYPSNNDQRHELKIVNMLKLKNWNFALSWIYGSGKPYTQPIGQYYVTLLNGKQKLISVPENKNSSRLPAFHSLDMSVNYNFRIGSGFAKVGLSIFNLYGRQNIKYRFYRIAEETNSDLLQSPVYKVYDIKLMGFTPNVSFSIDF
ncbi:MAG: hypothetical protein DRJ10_08775 [Bacteroidetes bacterium]|nr:MAG: hypothetical protein DRJ10_08775 [Bacteroidota bacterium]